MIIVSYDHVRVRVAHGTHHLPPDLAVVAQRERDL